MPLATSCVCRNTSSAPAQSIAELRTGVVDGQSRWRPFDQAVFRQGTPRRSDSDKGPLFCCVVAVDSIGDPQSIVSGTTRTPKPAGLEIAHKPAGLAIAHAARAIQASDPLADGLSFHTGGRDVSRLRGKRVVDLEPTCRVADADGIAGRTEDLPFDRSAQGALLSRTRLLS